MAVKPAASLSLRGFPGVDQSLVYLSQTTGLTRHLTLASPNPEGLEARFFAEHLRESRPRLVIFGGWSPVYARLLEALRDEPIGLAVHWHSSPGQTDMSREVEKLAAVLVEPRIDYLLFASPAFVAPLSLRGDVHYLPHTLEIPRQRTPEPRPATGPGEPLAITLFCAAAEYRRKNVINSLLALAGLRGEYRLLLNGLSLDPDYRVLLDALGLRYEERGWMERGDYEAAVATAGLGLQVSFAESYCYVAAEHLARGVPVLGSPMVPVFERLSPAVRRRLVVAAPEDPAEIREKVQFFLDRPAARAEIGERARAELAAASARDARAARELLAALIERGRRGS